VHQLAKRANYWLLKIVYGRTNLSIQSVLYVGARLWILYDLRGVDALALARSTMFRIGTAIVSPNADWRCARDSTCGRCFLRLNCDGTATAIT
jgi:hypothetical protein